MFDAWRFRRIRWNHGRGSSTSTVNTKRRRWLWFPVSSHLVLFSCVTRCCEYWWCVQLGRHWSEGITEQVSACWQGKKLRTYDKTHWRCETCWRQRCISSQLHSGYEVVCVIFYIYYKFLMNYWSYIYWNWHMHVYFNWQSGDHKT